MSSHSIHLITSQSKQWKMTLMTLLCTQVNKHIRKWCVWETWLLFPLPGLMHKQYAITRIFFIIVNRHTIVHFVSCNTFWPKVYLFCLYSHIWSILINICMEFFFFLFFVFFVFLFVCFRFSLFFSFVRFFVFFFLLVFTSCAYFTGEPAHISPHIAALGVDLCFTGGEF